MSSMTDVKRWLGLSLAVYVPHLIEEALTGMHDDPLLAAALGLLSALSARHAAYLVFQLMFVLLLVTTLLFSLGGRAQRLVMIALGLAMLAEAHHGIRAIATLHYNSGLATSLPLPVVGALLVRRMLA
jgi:hypothetical protein